MASKIKKDILISEVIQDPKLREVLENKYSLPCLGCPFFAMEAGYLTLEDVANSYGINLEELLNDLNKVQENKGSKSKKI